MSGRIRTALGLAKGRLNAKIANLPFLQEPAPDASLLDRVRHYDAFIYEADVALKKLKTDLENCKEGHKKWLDIVLKNPEV